MNESFETGGGHEGISGATPAWRGAGTALGVPAPQTQARLLTGCVGGAYAW
jgi:hypothetical protein